MPKVIGKEQKQRRKSFERIANGGGSIVNSSSKYIEYVKQEQEEEKKREQNCGIKPKEIECVFSVARSTSSDWIMARARTTYRGN